MIIMGHGHCQDLLTHVHACSLFSEVLIALITPDSYLLFETVHVREKAGSISEGERRAKLIPINQLR